MKGLFAVAGALALLCMGVGAQADVFNLGAGLTNLETVTVGDAGNAGDFRYGSSYYGYGPASYGSVGYTYNIGKYEVTTAQYCDFLNAKAKTDTYGLYNSYMADVSNQWGCNIQRNGASGSYAYSVASDWANRPVNYVSYWDSCRFANWLGNGQGNGDTETGAYTLNGYTGNDGRAIQRNAGWTWAVTSEDEWYKAAYYDPNKPGGAGYWDFATRSNTAPANQVLDTDPGNSANYFINGYFSYGSPYHRTNVGEFENSASAYGTFDQGGNVWEWNDAITQTTPMYAYRGQRGGALGNDDYELRASCRSDFRPALDFGAFGFRVSQVPEPSSIMALLGGLAGLFGARRRKA